MRTTNTESGKLDVIAPRTPGAQPTVVGSADTIAEARAIAANFDHRRDLRRQDVVIRLRHSGKRIEFAGPCR